MIRVRERKHWREERRQGGDEAERMKSMHLRGGAGIGVHC